LVDCEAKYTHGGINAATPPADALPEYHW
jgi:hypothetical protein